MSDLYAARKAPDEFQSLDYARTDGTIRSLKAKDGMIHPEDAEDDAALTGAGFEVDKASAKEAEKARAELAEAEAAEASEPMTPEEIEAGNAPADEKDAPK